MTTTKGTIEQAAERIAAAQTVLITCHRGPDGDSVGSMIALASLLKKRDRAVTLYNPDLVPRRLKWLPMAKKLVHRLPAKKVFDLTIVVDCGDRKLLGKNFPAKDVTGELIVLDHHASAVPFGDLYVCDPQAASVGVMVARIAEHLGWELDEDAARGIYVSMVTDTGSFRYSNTNAEAFRIATHLVADLGVDPWMVTERLSERVPLSKYKLLAAALNNLTLELDGKVSVIAVTHDMVKAAGGSWEDSEGIVNYARSISGVECGVMLTPAKRGGVRVSMRSKANQIDAGKICAGLGGGGHPGAAGCVLEGELDAARSRVLECLAAELGVPLKSAS